MDVFKKRLRFTDHDDLTLLREALGHNPFENTESWGIIRENVILETGKNFSIRTLREHLDRTIKLWIKQENDLENKFRSGIKVVITEKDTLCKNIFDMMVKSQERKSRKITMGVKQRGIDSRQRCTTRLTNNEEELNVEVGRTESTDLIAQQLNKVDMEISLIKCEIDQTDFQTEDEYSTDIVNITDQHCFTAVKEKEETGNELDREAPKTSGSPNNMKTVSSATNKQIGFRKRKAYAVQRRGLVYLKGYEKERNAIRMRELDLEERKLALQEQEFRLKDFEIKKKLELEDKKLEMEVENQKMLERILTRQDDIIKLLLTQRQS